MGRKFLPDGLSLVGDIRFLQDDERIFLSQIQGRTYANLFGLVERFICAKVIDRSGKQALGDPVASEARVYFADEELKHQEMFRRLERMAQERMPAGYRFLPDPNEVARAVLGKADWAVLGLSLYVELFVLTHYRESIADADGLDPLWKDVFHHHWKEESQHAVIDESEWREEDRRLTAKQRDRAIGDFLDLVAAIDGILRAQSARDAAYFTDNCGRVLDVEEMESVRRTLLKAYRWQYILAGIEVPRFQRVLGELISPGQGARVYAALETIRRSMIMNPNKALWEKGDFTRIADFMRESGEDLVKSLGVSPSMKVLDVGCGDGTTAVPAARAGAEVLGVDISAPLVRAGVLRAGREGLSRLSFLEGDACDLAGIPDASYDLTISIFGAMFAPRPMDVARELVRVTKPGGRVVMGNWIPGDLTFVSQLLKACSEFMPAPQPGATSPMDWGLEPRILERFAHAGVGGDRITMRRDLYSFRSPDVSPERFVEMLERYYGPTMSAFEAAAATGRADELRRRLRALALTQNRTKGNGTSIDAAFMRVTVRL